LDCFCIIFKGRLFFIAPPFFIHCNELTTGSEEYFMKMFLCGILVIFAISCSLLQLAFPSAVNQTAQPDVESHAGDLTEAVQDASPLALALPPSDRLLLPEDLTYLGAFRLPGESGGSSWEYSGHGLTFYPDGDPSSPGMGFLVRYLAWAMTTSNSFPRSPFLRLCSPAIWMICP
jgi:hypothetical protein